MKAIYADLDQIVFENKEHAYGAYNIRRNHSRILMRALLIGLLMFLSLTALPRIIGWMMPALPIEMVDEPTILPIIRDIPIPEVKVDDPEPTYSAPRPPQPKVAMTAFNVPRPSDKDLDDEDATINNMDDLEDSNIGPFDQDGVDDIADYPWDELDKLPANPPFEEKPAEEDDESFVGLTRMPEPIDLDLFKKTIKYPELAKEAHIEGTVKIKVKVKPDGTYDSHTFEDQAHDILRQEVAKKIKELRFIPALRDGKPTKFWVKIPFKFSLQD